MRTIWFQRGGPGGSAVIPHRGAATPGQKLAQIVGGRSAKAQSPCSTGSQRAEDRLGPDGVFQLCADYVAGRPSTALVRSYGLSKGAEQPDPSRLQRERDRLRGLHDGRLRDSRLVTEPVWCWVSRLGTWSTLVGDSRSSARFLALRGGRDSEYSYLRGGIL
jgi:hypothetical protein